MKRNEYNEFLYARKIVKEVSRGERSPYEFYSDYMYSADYKIRMNELFESIGFYPVRVGYMNYDTKKQYGLKIIYVRFGTKSDWADATTFQDRLFFRLAITSRLNCRELPQI